MAIFGASFTASAQPPSAQQDAKIKSMKVAFLTEQLNLTPAEAEKFWPLYNAYSDEKRALRKSAGNDKSSDAYIKMKEKELALEKKYISQFKAVLPQAKVDKLHAAEKKFKQQLIDHARARRSSTSPK